MNTRRQLEKLFHSNCSGDMIGSLTDLVSAKLKSGIARYMTIKF